MSELAVCRCDTPQRCQTCFNPFHPTQIPALPPPTVPMQADAARPSTSTPPDNQYIRKYSPRAAGPFPTTPARETRQAPRRRRPRAIPPGRRFPLVRHCVAFPSRSRPQPPAWLPNGALLCVCCIGPETSIERDNRRSAPTSGQPSPGIELHQFPSGIDCGRVGLRKQSNWPTQIGEIFETEKQQPVRVGGSFLAFSDGGR